MRRAICQGEACDVDGVAEAVFGEFRRSIAWPADIGGGMVDRCQVGTEAGFGARGGDILHEAGGRARHVAIQNGLRGKLIVLPRLFSVTGLATKQPAAGSANGSCGSNSTPSLRRSSRHSRSSCSSTGCGLAWLCKAGGPLAAPVVQRSRTAWGAARRLAGRRQQAPAGLVAMLEPVPIAARRPRFRAGLLARRWGQAPSPAVWTKPPGRPVQSTSPKRPAQLLRILVGGFSMPRPSC